jgi:hypothetical protein
VRELSFAISVGPWTTNLLPSSVLATCSRRVHVSSFVLTPKPSDGIVVINLTRGRPACNVWRVEVKKNALTVTLGARPDMCCRSLQNWFVSP